MLYRFSNVCPLAACSALFAAVLLAPALTAKPPVAPDGLVVADESSRIATIRKVSPAVLAVCAQGGQGMGSGVLIDPAGYALTNYHVVAATGPVMSCGLESGELYDAVLVGQDRVGDVAVIKLLPKTKGQPFPFVKLGDSDAVRIGDWSLAMGNPFSLALDFTPTVTFGLISGVNRYQPPEAKALLEYTDCIQIETSINPGNSGGPLFDMKGELIGINGRGSFEKRMRINSGVGYAISINQIKNFLGHLYAGFDADHATLGAQIRTSEESGLSSLTIGQILDDSDAYHRGLRPDDQLVMFGGRQMSSTNQYKNILGTFPKSWRVPLVYRRNNSRTEVLVRLAGALPPEAAEPTVGPRPGGPAPKTPPKVAKASPATKLLKPKPGYANYYFNEIERDRLLTQSRRHGDFSTLKGNWTAEGTYDMGMRKGEMRLDFLEGKGDGGLSLKLKLNIEHTLEPLKSGLSERDQMEPIGSGGLMMALYHYRRLLTLGAKGFELGCTAGGFEPFYPFPIDGSVPKSLSSLRVDTEVLHTQHGSVSCRWHFSRTDHTLLGCETTVSKDEDPCEVYFSDYKNVDGRMLPHRIEVRHGDKRYGVLTINSFKLLAS